MTVLGDLTTAIDGISSHQTQTAKTAILDAIVAYIAACKAGTEGLLASAAEVNLNTTASPGVATTSKTVVLGAYKNLDEFHVAASKLYLGADAGTAMTATAAELNKKAGVVAGTASASKPAVLGPSKNLDVFGLPVGGLLIGVAGAEVATTPTAAEINVLTGATANAAELSIMDGVTDTPAELNLVDDKPAAVSIVHAQGAANAVTITINVLDAAGAALDTPTLVDFWISNSPEGVGIALVPADSIAATKGNVQHVATAAEAIRVQTAIDGIAILTLTSAAKGNYYLCTSLPGIGTPQVHSGNLSSANYG